MSNKIISEENPAAPQSSSAPQPGGGAQDKIRKQARQLAYDTRYKVKGQFKDGQKTDAANLKKAYMSQLGKSPAPGPVKQLAKKMLVGEEYDFVDVDTFASDSVKDIIGKVFVEAKNRTYKIRVTDKVSKKTYVRMATREKISQLRSNPNISSVEMTGYGDPYEGQKKDKKAKKDYDGDGKVESPTAEYKGSKDKAIKKSMAKEAYTVTAADKKGNTPAWQGYKAGKKNPKTGENVYKAADHLKNEEFIGEIKDPEDDNPDANVKKVDVMKGKNKIIINPNQSESVEAPTDTAPEKPKESSAEKRVRMVKRSILQKKMQAVRSGAGADIVAHNEPEGEVLTEEFINEHIEYATEYFYKEGLNEDGLELVIEDLGIDEFTEFVLESAQELNEERAATKAPKRDYEKVKAAVYKKDAERKAKGTGEYSKTKAAKAKYGDKPAPEGKPEKKVAVKKKVEKSVAKAKKAQPAKPTSKQGLGSKIRSAVSKGVERHKAATKKASGEVKKIAKTASDTAKQHAGHRKKFMSGLKATKKEKKVVSGIGKAVKKAVVGEDAKYGYDSEGKSLNPADQEKESNVPQNSVTFDGGATIEPVGDSRELPTIVTLIKNKLRARGLNMSHELEGEVINEKKSDTLATEAKVDTVKKLDDEGKEDARNYRKYGTKHSQFMQAVRRRGEHRSERGVKKIKGQKPAPKGAYGEEVTLEAMSSYERNRRRAAQRAQARNDARAAGKTGSVPGVGYVSPHPERATYRDAKNVERHGKTDARVKSLGGKKGVKEEKDQAFANVVAKLRAQHGKDSVLTKDSPKPKAQPKPKAKPQKPLTSKEKAQREVDARYGRTAWNKKGSLGT